MVGRWGMSAAVVPIAVLSAHGSAVPAGAAEVSPYRSNSSTRRCSCRRESQRGGFASPGEPRQARFARTPAEHETLDEDDAYAPAGGRPGAKFVRLS